MPAPAVRQALEQAKVAEILLCQEARKFAEFIRRMTQVLCEQIHLAHDAPEQTFAHGAGGQVVIADLETVEHVIVQLNGIVPAFEQILRGEPLVNAVKVFQRVGCVVFDFVDILVEDDAP